MKKADWIMLSTLLTIFLCCFAGPAYGQSCEQMVYSNQNQIDYGPIEIQRVRGIGVDSAGVTVPHFCVGIFSIREHKLLRHTASDGNGVFAMEMNDLPDGEYRLVVDAVAFCPANARIRIRSSSHRKKSLVAHMRVGGIDTCSFIDASKN